MAVLTPVVRQLQRLLKDESGATFVEYCLFITAISIGIGFFIPDLGELVNGLFVQTAAEIDAVATDVELK